jgi:hypothetical protein
MAEDKVHVEVDEDNFDATVSSTTGTEEDTENINLASRETLLVNRFKWLVYIVIPLAAAVTVTFFFMTDGERTWYEDEVSSYDLISTLIPLFCRTLALSLTECSIRWDLYFCPPVIPV